MLQQEDLVAFGRLIIMLCCANPHAVNNLPKAIEIIGRHYTTDVKNVVLFLLSKPSQHKVEILAYLCRIELTRRCYIEHFSTLRHARKSTVD